VYEFFFQGTGVSVFLFFSSLILVRIICTFME
jgi:hypothetical protein